jgi:osmotically-inducible protein OsmY
MDRIVTDAGVLERRIQQALTRDLGHDSRRVRVSVRGARVALTGDVCSWADHEAAERAALSVPGVAMVDNQLCLSVKGTLAR